MKGNAYNMALHPAVAPALQIVRSRNSYEFINKMVITSDKQIGKVWADSADGATLTLDLTPDAPSPTFLDVPTTSVRLVQDMQAVIAAITKGSWYTNSKACKQFVESKKVRWCTVKAYRNVAELEFVGMKQTLIIYRVSDSTARTYDARYKLYMSV